MKAVKKVWKALDSFEEIFAPCLFVVMCIAVFAQIVFRVVLKNPLLVSEEIARFSYVWVVFLCMSLGERDREHFCVDVFLKFLKGKADLAVQLVESLIAMAAFAYLFYWSIRFVSFEAVIKSAAMEISMAYVAAAMCVGFGLCIIRRGRHTWNIVHALAARKEEVR